MSTEIRTPDGTLTIDHASAEVLLESATAHGQTSQWLSTDQALELASALIGAVLSAQQSERYKDSPNEGEPWKRWSKDSPSHLFPCPHCRGEVVRIESDKQGGFNSFAADGIMCCGAMQMTLRDARRPKACGNCGDTRGLCGDVCVKAENE